MAETSFSLPVGQNTRLIQRLEQQCGFKLHQCYQCGKCSASCPMAAAMDLAPHQVLRYLQLGLTEEALHSRTPWLCVSCQACSARCPHDVPMAELLAALRQQAEQAGIYPMRRPRLFTKSFLRPVAWFGRSHELTMTAFYNITSGRLWQHFSYLPAMLKGRKLKFLPAHVQDSAAIRRLMDNCAKEAERI